MGPKELKLPIKIVGRAEINGCLRELQSIDDYLAAAPAKDSKAGSGLKLSQLLSTLAQANGYKLLEADQRKELHGRLTTLAKKSPLLHISFAADPSAEAVERILVWLRANIHAHTLLQIGLQPNIVVGCVLRTPNHIFDLSLRSHIQNQQDQLVKLIAKAVV